MNLHIGQSAPDFTSASDAEITLSLQHFKGNNIILYFYPKDDTPGCTLESCGFRDHYVEFKNLNTEILGISKDSIVSHQKFKTKYQLPFPLLSDPEMRVCRAYDVIGQKSMYGKTYEGIIRSTFLIDPQGIIQAIWRQVKVPGHIEEIIKQLKKQRD